MAMHVLLVYAHLERKSFNGALRDLTVEVLTEAGHTVEVSDLWAMNFNPVGGQHDFTRPADPDFFNYALEQARATEAGTFAADVAAEQEKLFRADLLIFQFPLWWFGLPAILKGWVDRVFAAGLTYGGRFYSKGVFRGRRAMLSLTTGGSAAMYNPRGLNGHIDLLLYPINHGILHFVGFDVLPPFVAYAVPRTSPDRRRAYLQDYAQLLRTWETATPLSFHTLDDCDETLQLRANQQS
jgi:NAD(P)H dehydrogenase (quinone)